MPPIRCFSSYVRKTALIPVTMKNCPLVVDGTNYFYRIYEESGLPYENGVGVEGDLYADYLRRKLFRFRRAKVECYFIFKAGYDGQRAWRENWCRGEEPHVRPIFITEIHTAVLDEIGFKYGFTEFETKAACVMLAEWLNCPVLTYDVEFCFQTEKFIMSTDLQFKDDALVCSMFTRENFMQQHGVTERQYALFRVLVDEKYFEFNFFDSFLTWHRISNHVYKRHGQLLKWLSTNRDPEEVIKRYVSEVHREQFARAVESALTMPGDTSVVDWLLEETPLPQIGEPGWFKAMVFTDRATKYVDVYRPRITHGSWVDPDPTQPDALSPFLDILQYALDLLTDYENEGFVFQSRGCKEVVMKREVPRPENGLGSLDARLFEHWAQARLGLKATDLWCLEGLPRDTGILVMSLLLCARAVVNWSRDVAYACLLRHVLGGRVYRNGERIEACTPHQRHLLLTAQLGLQQLVALRRLCGDVRWRWLDVGRASNAARALAVIAQKSKPRKHIRKDLANVPELLEEFTLLADAYDDLQPGVKLQPGGELAPNVEIQSDAELRPGVELQPAVELPLSVEIQPVAELKPAVELQPALELPSRVDIQPDAVLQPAVTRPGSKYWKFVAFLLIIWFWFF